MKRKGDRKRRTEAGPSGDFQRVGDLLEGFFDRLGLTEEVARQEMLTRWETVVGPRVADVTQASAVSGGTLFVKVDSSAWLNELNLMRHDLLARLNAGRDSGRVERIVFTLSGGPSPERRSGEGSREG